MGGDSQKRQLRALVVVPVLARRRIGPVNHSAPPPPDAVIVVALVPKVVRHADRIVAPFGNPGQVSVRLQGAVNGQAIIDKRFFNGHEPNPAVLQILGNTRGRIRKIRGRKLEAPHPVRLADGIAFVAVEKPTKPLDVEGHSVHRKTVSRQ